jgi:Undecaprenyl-phosphate glucose phosphotransferase
MSNFQKINVPLLVFGDIINLSLAFFISIYFFGINELSSQGMNVVFWIGLVFMWLVIGKSNNLYADLGNSRFFKIRMSKYIKTYIIVAGILGLMDLIFHFSDEIRNLLLAILIGIPILEIISSLLIIYVFTPIQEEKSKVNHILVVGSGNLAGKVKNHLTSNPLTKYAIDGFIDCNTDRCASIQKEEILTSLENLKDYLKDKTMDEIIIALPFYEIQKIKNVIRVADYYGVRVRFVPDYESVLGTTVKSYHYGELEVVNVRQLPLDNVTAAFTKTLFDKIFSLSVLVFLAPLFVFIAFLIKWDSKGPVFYTPNRIGKGGKPFKLYKFRTMSINDDPNGGTNSTVKNDPRITKIGKFLRKSSIDELPQFLNVFLGDMSVVGPRPHRVFLNQLMQESEEQYMVRHYHKPGITGWAQVNGWRGPLETAEQKTQRTEHDIWYLENWTFMLDLKIIYLTIFGSKTHQTAF